MKNLLYKKLHNYELSINESKELFLYILRNFDKQSDILWGTYWGLTMFKTPSFDEVIGMIEAIQEIDKNFVPFYKDKIKVRNPIKCITGSGKEDYKTFNISTLSALILSKQGLKVLKPSSRSVSANCGSLDILESCDALIIDKFEDLKKLDELMSKNNLIAFDFEKINMQYAKRYSNSFNYFHPLSFIMPALAIPVQMDRLVYGVASKNVNFVKQLLDYYGYKDYFVVSSEVLDEKLIDEMFPDRFYIASDKFYSKDSKSLNISIDLEKIKQGNSVSECCNEFKSILRKKDNLDAISLGCLNASLMICRKDLSDIIEIYNVIREKFLND